MAVLNGVAWGLLTPPFQVPDEIGHIGYAQYVAETGKPPSPAGTGARFRGGVNRFSEEETNLLEAVRFSVEGHPSWSKADDAGLRRVLSTNLNRKSETGAADMVNNPPLYYYLAAGAAKLADGADFITRIFFMRLVSALLAGMTVACVFLFLRELLPATPWAWTVGALAVAFQPMFGFIAGGVNNDNLLYAASAAALFLLARAFRRGLSPALGAAIGAVVAVGLLAKSTMFGLVPGLALGVALAAWRTPRERRRAGLAGALIAVVIVAVPFGVWLIANDALLDRSGTTTAGVATPQGRTPALNAQLSYLWQYFLPRLPFMTRQPHYYGLWEVYFQGFVGRFGQFYFGFPLWANEVALGVFTAVAALAIATLVRMRAALRSRWLELASYAAVAVGLLVAVNIVSYRYLVRYGVPFEQARYLLPLLALYGAVVALAARGAGRRWGPAVGAFLVVLAIGHSVFAMLLTVGHYYA